MNELLRHYYQRSGCHSWAVTSLSTHSLNIAVSRISQALNRKQKLAKPQAEAASPTDIILHQQSRVLEVAFDDDQRFRLSCEFLRVHSPSAEVRGHGPGQDVLQMGKKDVTILAVEPVGNYAVKLVFSDGHDTGLFSWDYLHTLGINHDSLWNTYLQRLKTANASRDA